MTRILSIAADRSHRGVCIPGSQAYKRQQAYADNLGVLDIVCFSLGKDGFKEQIDVSLRVHPTRSITRLLYISNALFAAAKLPWPDAVSAQDPFETGIVAMLIARFLKVPLYVQVHTDFLSPAYARHSILNRIRVFIGGRVLKRATRIRVVSARIKRSLEEKYKLKTPITVLPIYADVEMMRGAHAEDSITARFASFHTRLLYAGRLESEKNPCLALRAFADVAPKNSCLIVVGAGSERARLENLALELGVESRVFFEGEADPAPYFALSDLVLVPSLYEGYGLVIVEALAAGKPVLATDVGVAKEAGATVAEDGRYAEALKEWFISGSRTGTLQGYPYQSFDGYVQAYCDDIRASITSQ